MAYEQIPQQQPSDAPDAGERAWARDKADFVAYADVPDHPAGNPGPSPLVAEFTALTQALLNTTTVAGVLDQVVDAAYRIVPGADLVSITLRSTNGEFHTPVDTGPLATELDQLQYETGEGPCVDAARLNGPGHVYSDDLAREPAWPRFAPAAAGHGFAAVLSTALLPDVRPPRLTGALNIYSHRSDVLRGRAKDTALLLATHASLALACTQSVGYAELKQQQLERALASRHHLEPRRERARKTLDRAKQDGVLPATTDVDMVIDMMWGTVLHQLVLAPDDRSATELTAYLRRMLRQIGFALPE